jgi:hypothetical protein
VGQLGVFLMPKSFVLSLSYQFVGLGGSYQSPQGTLAQQSGLFFLEKSE